jgi:hypothetical protein
MVKMNLTKKTFVAQILTALTVLCFVVFAGVIYTTHDPYVGLVALALLIPCSLALGTAALVAWAWGRPAKPAIAIILGGVIVATVLYVGTQYHYP